MDSNGRKTSFMKYYPYDNLVSIPGTHPGAERIEFVYLDEGLPLTTVQLRCLLQHYLPHRLRNPRVSTQLARPLNALVQLG